MKRERNTAEESILEAAERLYQQGIKEFYGFQIAKEMKEHSGSRLLIGYGTLYTALYRLEQKGLLCSRWEDQSAEHSGPRRRYYRLINQNLNITEEEDEPSVPEIIDSAVAIAVGAHLIPVVEEEQ